MSRLLLVCLVFCSLSLASCAFTPGVPTNRTDDESEKREQKNEETEDDTLDQWLSNTALAQTRGGFLAILRPRA